MTSRERIRAAINHQPVDMLPIDFGGMRSTGINIVAYDQLKKHLGIQGGMPKLYDVYQQLAEPELEVLNRLGGDVVQAHRLCPAFGLPIRNWRKATLPQGVECLVPSGYFPQKIGDGSYMITDGTGRAIARMPSNGQYFDSVYFPLENAESKEDIDAATFSTITDEELDFIEAEVKYLYENTDKAILFAFGGNILEAGESWFGFEKFMEYLLTEPDLVHYFLTKLTNAYLMDLQKIMPRIYRYIDTIQFGDDLGTQASLLISPTNYRDMIKPYHQQQYSYIRKNFSTVKVFLHSCGAISELIPQLIDAGVEILNPVQISANGMDPYQLKKSYGHEIVFWGGGANMQYTVLNEGIEKIKQEVRSLIDIFSVGSGFVFNQVHNIQANVSPEKILAIYDAALEYRR